MADLTNNGECSRCGQCCSNFIPLTEEERTRLRELVKGDVEVQIKQIPDGRVMMLCPFLILNNANNISRCSIYEDRPSICRIFKCDTKQRMSAKESEKYAITDLMKDIVHYDYQKENNMTYEEAMSYQLQICRNDRLKEETNGKANLQ